MEFRVNKAIYMQIADWICEQIISGEWPPGEKLPSVRELAVELEVNPNTIARTYEWLQNSDIIVSRRGIGLFVVEDALDKARNYLRGDFLENDLPRVFRYMKLLGISDKELLLRYHQ